MFFFWLTIFIIGNKLGIGVGRVIIEPKTWHEIYDDLYLYIIFSFFWSSIPTISYYRDEKKKMKNEI